LHKEDGMGIVDDFFIEQFEPVQPWCGECGDTHYGTCIWYRTPEELAEYLQIIAERRADSERICEENKRLADAKSLRESNTGIQWLLYVFRY